MRFHLGSDASHTSSQRSLLTMVEAKNGVIEQGLGQCAAQMFGALLFNEQEGMRELPVFGCVTTGDVWQFLKLEGKQLMVDNERYYISDPGTILAILNAVIASAGPKPPSCVKSYTTEHFLLRNEP